MSIKQLCTVHKNSLFCARHSNAKHESPDLMSMISWKWNSFICNKIPQPLWSINATRLLSVAVIFINWPYAHEKVKKKKMICRSSCGWHPSCFIQKEAPWSLLGWEWVLSFCSARRCWFTASLSVSHRSYREDIINCWAALNLGLCVRSARRHTTGANICTTHTHVYHVCACKHNVCTINGVKIVSLQMLLHESMNPSVAAW